VPWIIGVVEFDGLAGVADVTVGAPGTTALAVVVTPPARTSPAVTSAPPEMVTSFFWNVFK
jgi:hypothetical protein